MAAPNNIVIKQDPNENEMVEIRTVDLPRLFKGDFQGVDLIQEITVPSDSSSNFAEQLEEKKVTAAEIAAAKAVANSNSQVDIC